MNYRDLVKKYIDSNSHIAAKGKSSKCILLSEYSRKLYVSFSGTKDYTGISVKDPAINGNNLKEFGKLKVLIETYIKSKKPDFSVELCSLNDNVIYSTFDSLAFTTLGEAYSTKSSYAKPNNFSCVERKLLAALNNNFYLFTKHSVFCKYDPCPKCRWLAVNHSHYYIFNPKLQDACIHQIFIPNNGIMFKTADYSLEFKWHKYMTEEGEYGSYFVVNK